MIIHILWSIRFNLALSFLLLPFYLVSLFFCQCSSWDFPVLFLPSFRTLLWLLWLYSVPIYICPGLGLSVPSGPPRLLPGWSSQCKQLIAAAGLESFCSSNMYHCFHSSTRPDDRSKGLIIHFFVSFRSNIKLENCNAIPTFHEWGSLRSWVVLLSPLLSNLQALVGDQSYLTFPWRFLK